MSDLPIDVRVIFGAVEADGTHVIVNLHVIASLPLGMQVDRRVALRLPEERAHRLVNDFHAALSKLNRTRLPPA